MKPGLIILFAFVISQLAYHALPSSNNINRHRIENNDKDIQIIFRPDSNKSINFINDVISKNEIDKEVVRKNTIIDSVFFCDDCTFQGDSLYRISDKFLILFLDYNGMNCAYKFLLVYDKNKRVNTDYTIGATDCDRDYSAVNFHTLSNKIVNDSIIKITTHYYHVNSTEENKKRQINDFFFVNKEGKFEKQNMK